MVVNAPGRAPTGTPPPQRDHAYWRAAVAPYERASLGAALFGLATSALPYLALTAAMYLLLPVSLWLTLLLAIPASGFLLRTFIVFHDCTHGSYMPTRRGNLWVGRLTGLIVFQPFANWRHNHAVPRGSAGDLDRRGYRLFRSSLVMFGIGPVWSLTIGPRFWTKGDAPTPGPQRLAHRRRAVRGGRGADLDRRRGRLAAGADAGRRPGRRLGVFLFYVQHQFEDAYWETGEQWSYADAALKGSSYLKLPQPFQFFSGNIGLHHVHHLSAKIPNHNLQRAHDENAIFRDAPILTFTDGLRTLRLKLIDPAAGLLLTWRQAVAATRRPGREGPVGKKAQGRHEVALT